MTAKLRVGGFVPFSATDYPGLLSAVVFCQGCPWRCGYCHNPHLLPARGAHEIEWAEVLAFLRTRVGLLDAVVFSGGEPTAQTGLADAMREVKALGFRIGLHTGGAYPARLAGVLPLVDWVGLDVKAPYGQYKRVTGVPGSGERARECARLVVASGLECQLRTTFDRTLLDAADIDAIERDLARIGAQRPVLQTCR